MCALCMWSCEWAVRRQVNRETEGWTHLQLLEPVEDFVAIAPVAEGLPRRLGEDVALHDDFGDVGDGDDVGNASDAGDTSEFGDVEFGDDVC